jgi:hypothetical protein
MRTWLFVAWIYGQCVRLWIIWQAMLLAQAMAECGLLPWEGCVFWFEEIAERERENLTVIVKKMKEHGVDVDG